MSHQRERKGQLNGLETSFLGRLVHPTLDFGLGHDLPVCKTKPHSELIADSFSLSLSKPNG